MRNIFFKSRWVFYIVFVLAVVLLVFRLCPAPQEIKVKEVEDGDTIVLSNGDRVRYIGIDTPETKCWLSWEATKANEEMVKGKEITLRYGIDSLDDSGRVLAYVWVDSLLINAELIKKGLAWVYTVSPNLDHREHFISLQKQAREKKLGVWSIPVSLETLYVATEKSREFIFHRPDCEAAKKIKSENLIRFETRDEALDSGYRPCKKCWP